MTKSTEERITAAHQTLSTAYELCKELERATPTTRATSERLGRLILRALDELEG